MAEELGSISKALQFILKSPYSNLSRTVQSRLVPRSDLRLVDLPVLNEGGFGQVRAGLYYGKRVAVKVLRSRTNDGAPLSQELLNDLLQLELEALTELFSNAHVAMLWGVCPPDSGSEADDEVFLVMDFVPGVNLSTALQHVAFRKLSPEVRLAAALLIGCSIARCLQYIHSRNVCHLDLKPSNVMLSVIEVPAQFAAAAGTSISRRFEVDTHVVDFGIARLTACVKPNATTLLTLRAPVQSKFYASPEQRHATHYASATIAGRAKDLHPPEPMTKRSDIYSFSVMMIEVLSGQTTDLIDIMIAANTVGKLLVDGRLCADVRDVLLRGLHSKVREFFCTCAPVGCFTHRVALQVDERPEAEDVCKKFECAVGNLAPALVAEAEAALAAILGADSAAIVATAEARALRAEQLLASSEGERSVLQQELIRRGQQLEAAVASAEECQAGAQQQLLATEQQLSASEKKLHEVQQQLSDSQTQAATLASEVTILSTDMKQESSRYKMKLRQQVHQLRFVSWTCFVLVVLLAAFVGLHQMRVRNCIACSSSSDFL